MGKRLYCIECDNYVWLPAMLDQQIRGDLWGKCPNGDSHESGAFELMLPAGHERHEVAEDD